jgi:hypothetical protein
LAAYRIFYDVRCPDGDSAFVVSPVLIERIHFDDVSMIDLIHINAVRDAVKQAEGHFKNQNYEAFCTEIAKARYILFDNAIKSYFPEVDRNLRQVDSLFEEKNRGVRVFEYLSQYLNVLRDSTIANSCGLSIKDFKSFESKLPNIVQYGDGRFEVTWGSHTTIPTAKESSFLLQFMIDLALKVQDLI